MTKKELKIDNEYKDLKYIKEKKYLNFKDYLRIHNFKAQISVELNENYIKGITKKAFSLAKKDNESDTKESLRLLCKLNGVAVPIASTILHFKFPNTYAIMDTYCWRNAREIDKTLSKFYGDKERAINNYIKYLKIIRDVAKEKKKSLRSTEYGWFKKERNKGLRKN